MANIKDVARLAGVNISTVSRVLSGRKKVSEPTKERVLEAIRTLDYEPNILAQGLKGGQTFNIALVIPNIRNAIFPSVSRGVEDSAARNGYNLILCNTDEDSAREKAYIEMLRKRFVDGAIFVTATSDSDYLFELARSGYPLVALMRKLGENVDTVVLENVESAYMGTSYLLGLGCRKVALINGPGKISQYRERFDGYRKALYDKGIDFEPELNQEMYTQRDFQSGYQAMALLLDRKYAIDGVFATNDNVAVGAVLCLGDRGFRVPADVKVLGFGNLDIAQIVTPALSTVSQPLYKMGEAAMELLISRINSPSSAAREIIFPGELIVRAST